MKLEAAIAKSPIGAAQRHAFRTGTPVVAMRIKGQISIVESLINPAIKRKVPSRFDLTAENWEPIRPEKEKAS
jgi:hypothetical protein